MPIGQSWFNSDLWKNHYQKTQRLGNQQQQAPVAGTATVAPPPAPGPPTLDLSGVGNAGQKPVAGPVTTPTPPSPVMPTPPTTPPAPAPSAAPAPGPLNGAYQGLEGDVLRQIASGVNGTAALPGTEAAMRRNRETLAQYAGGMERQAGARATKSGAIGQGTAATLGDDTKSNVLSKLAENAQNETQIISTEKQGLIDRAGQAVQVNQAREQFAASSAQRKEEFDKTFGSQESAKYLNQLERMAQDNPVLAEKLSNYLMEGKTGPVGAFTAEEKAKLAEFVKKKQGSQDKLDEVMSKILEGLPAQVLAGQQNSTDSTAAAAATNHLNTLKPGEYLSDAEFTALQKSSGIKQVTMDTMPKGAGPIREWLAQNPHGIVNVEGKQYKVVRGGRAATGSGTFNNQVRHTDWVEVIDTATGQTKYIVAPYNNDGKSHGYSKEKAGIYDKPPKRGDGVGDWTPFGF